jgi:diketogulonate reductase-like aldo/keto reductase
MALDVAGPGGAVLLLNNGVKLPLIGMGTYPLNGLRLAWLVRRATAMGYRGFDTASAYGNERWLGRGLRLSLKKREDYFVTSKLSNTEQRAGDVRRACTDSLARLGLKSLDLYLMHWPNPDTFRSCWRQMEQLYREGLVRAIGVCNFHAHHLQQLLEVASVIPAVNQVELHPLLSQTSLVAFCRQHDIQVQAYSPFARMHGKLLGSAILGEIAARCGKTVPQVILRWHCQHQLCAVPKSANSTRLKQNLAVSGFTLTEQEMQHIDGLNINFRVRHDPDHCDFTRL